MMEPITNYNELALAIRRGDKTVTIGRNITVNHTLILNKGITLRGEPQENGELPMILFTESDGLGLTANNTIQDLKVSVPVSSRAIFTTHSEEDLGTFRLENLSVQGQVSFIFRMGTTRASIAIKDLDIYAADARRYLEQPQKYGVNVLQGALTIYNLNSDPKSLIKVNAEGVNIGRYGMPVAGSGIFISGFGDKGGKTEIALLETEEVHSTGKIPYGVANYITGGVFVLYGAHAENVITQGRLVTYGVNDMVTDVWGSVDHWISNGPITSYGPSGIGFVNFGNVGTFEANAPVETYGEGARGYNQYDGTVHSISFKSIQTFGDGSIGIQISKPIGSLTVSGDVTTYGKIGNSLIKGVINQIPAYAISIKEGGSIDSLVIRGNVTTHGDNVTTYIVEKGGSVKDQQIDGKVSAKGKDSISKAIQK